MTTNNRTGMKFAALGSLGLVAVVGVIAIGRLVMGPGPTGANGADHFADLSTIEAVLESVQEYRLAGDDGRAHAVLESAVGQYVEDQTLRLAFGDLLLAERDPRGAYHQYVTALAIGPRPPEIEFTAGTVAGMIGRHDRAVEHYVAARTQDPTNSVYPLYLGQAQIKVGEVAAGKASLLAAAKLDPDRAIIWGTLAELAYRENKPTIALRHIAKARELEPRVLAWRIIEARSLKRNHQPEEAMAVLVGLSEQERSSPHVMQIMAECYGLLGRPADAAAMYAARSDTDPTDIEAARETAIWQERAGDTQAAIRFARRAADLGDEAGAKILERLGG